MSSHEAQQLELPFPETEGVLATVDDLVEAQRQEQQAEFAGQLQEYFARFQPRRIRT